VERRPSTKSGLACLIFRKYVVAEEAALEFFVATSPGARHQLRGAAPRRVRLPAPRVPTASMGLSAQQIKIS
jgi:hypothetical protein